MGINAARQRNRQRDDQDQRGAKMKEEGDADEADNDGFHDQVAL